MVENESHATNPTDSVASAAESAAIGGRVRQAVVWRTGTQLVAQAISWAATLIVIRLLNPADYGLYAMAAVMMTVLDFLNGYGFASALIQAKDLSQRAIRQALGITILLNVGIAALQFACAPLVAAYYGKPEVASLLRLLSCIYLATPFIIVPEVILSRTLDFRRQAIVNLLAAIVGAVVSLACALGGLGVWTLIYAPMALVATRAIGLTIAARLFILPTFDLSGSGHIVRFGAAMMASHLFWVVQSQSDVFIAGRLFSPHSVGLYAEALFLTQLVMAKFVPALNQVAFPAYARLQDDLPGLRWNFTAAVRLIMLATAPVYLGLAASAPALVEVLFGAKWLGMVPLIRTLALAMPLMTVQILFAPLHNALGRPDVSWKSAAGGALLFVTAFLIGAHWGTLGLASAWLVAAPLLLGWTIHLSRPITGITARDVLRAISPSLAAAAVMALAVFGVGQLVDGQVALPWRLTAEVGTGVLIYGLLALLLERPTVTRLMALVRPARRAAA